MTANTSKIVLICDDEPNIRESIRYVVEKAGFRCEQAQDGYEAYNIAHNKRPDLIILDVGMPGMTGFELCAKLRSEVEFLDTKIIILTAFGQVADEQRAHEVGANRFMIKPFSPRLLRETLHELMV